jgi:hypothetical protein
MQLDKVPGEFRVIRWGVRSFRGDYRGVALGDPQSQRLQELRKEFALDDVIRGAGSEFAALLALKRWVRSRWNHGYDHYKFQVEDGLDMLRAAQKGANFACGYYARTFVDCACALGFPARMVSISVEHCEFPRDYNYGNVGHAVAEVWSSEHEKWVLMDPDLNVYYSRGGVPLSALEIREAWLSGCADEVEVVADEPGFVIPGEDQAEVLRSDPLYAHFTVQTLVHLFERFNRYRNLDYYVRINVGGWDWVDERVLPTFVHHFAPRAARPTGNADELYPSLNMVRLQLTPRWDEEGAELLVRFEHCMPWFCHFELSVDGGAWQRCGESYTWRMHEGVNRLAVRPVNVCGRVGITSELAVAYASPQVRW